MMQAHNECAQFKESMDLFLQSNSDERNGSLLVLAVTACKMSGDVSTGESIYNQSIHSRPELQSNGQFISSVIDLFGKSGDIDTAMSVFDDCHSYNNSFHTAPPPLGVWNAMIASLGHAGRTDEVLQCFEQCKSHHTPDVITSVSVMNVLCHAGMTENVLSFYENEVPKNVRATEEVMTCVLDSLSRAGRLADAEDLLMGENGYVMGLECYRTVLNG